MVDKLLLSVTALATLAPASVLPYWRGSARPDGVYWALLAAAVAGPAAFATVQLTTAWSTTLSIALWLSIFATLLLFTVLAATMTDAWRLTPLLLPYLSVLGLLATVSSREPEYGHLAAAPDVWLKVHILVSLATYALCTVAAVAGCAVLVQERGLRRKRVGVLTRMLPAIADAERVQLRLLVAAELVLAVGVLTGMSVQFLSTHQLLVLDHKTLLSLFAFGLIALLLGLHFRTGLRGRRAARIVLAAYLLLTLAYPGVKFITDILIA